MLKKGNPRLLNNYRPVSCLPAASKVLEIVVCSQLSEYLELNKLLPRNQHGFRPRRSTMTAWNEIQLDWAQKTEDGLVTGVLLWDLSAAFDTLDCDGLCDKLQLFGVQQNSVKWVRSFLTGRRQRVKIGSRVSRPRIVPTGVPQGGCCRPSFSSCSYRIYRTGWNTRQHQHMPTTRPLGRLGSPYVRS